MDKFWVVNWSTDAAGLCDHVDPRWVDITGQTVARALGKGWFDTVHPDDREKAKVEFNRAGEERRPFQVVARLRQVDGGYRWGMAVGAPRYGTGGAFTGFAGSIIDFHERIAAEQELDDTRKRLEAIMNAAPVGLSYSTDVSCEYITGNAAMLAQLEVDVTANLSASSPNAEAAGRKVRYFSGERELTDAELPLQMAARERRTVEPIELEARLPSGRRVQLEASGAPYVGADGRMLGAVVVTVDVTERKKHLDALRASEQAYRSLFETSRDGIATVDLDGGIVEANIAYQRMLGYTLEELRRLNYRDLTPQRWHEMEADIVRKHVLPTGESAEYEKEYVRKDGSVFPVSLRTWTVTNESGSVVGMRAFVRDITERKRIDAALRASERRFRAIFDHQSQFAALLNPDGSIIEMSQSVLRTIGVDPSELIGTPFLDSPWWRDLPDVRARWRVQLEEALTRPGPSRGEAAYRMPDGSLRHALNTLTALRDDQGEVEYLIAEGIDITERKQAEERLRASEALLQAVLGACPDPIFLKDRDGRLKLANAATFAVIGKPSEACIGKTDEEFLHSSANGRAIMATDQRIMASGQGETVEEWVETAAGVRCYVSNKAPFRDSTGEIIGLIGSSRDVTEQRAAETALSNNVLRYRSLVDAVSAVTWRCQSSGMQNEAQPEWMAFTGQTAEEMLGEGWAKAVHPDDLEETVAKWMEAVSRGALFEHEQRVRRRDGQWRWMRAQVAPVRNSAGEVIEWFGMHVDVHDRHEAEEKLRKSEETLLNAQRSARAGVWDVDLITDRVAWSEPYYELFALPRSEQPSHESWIASVHPDDRQRVEAEYERALETRGAQRIEFRILREGETRWLHSEGRVICDDADRPIRITGITWDITDRKLAEEALRQSRDDLDRAQEVGKIGWWRLDVRRNLLTWPEQTYRIFGMQPGTPLTYECFLSVVHPDDRNDVDRHWQAGLRGEPYDVEHRIVVAGQVRWVREKAYLEFDAAGAVLGGFGVTQDITDRKRAEAALRESEERFRASFANAAIGFAMMGPDLQVLDANPAEFRIRRHDGAFRWFRTMAAPLRDETGAVVKWFGSNTDVDDIKQAELALRQSQQQLALALEAGQLGFWDWHLPSGNVQFGGCWASMLGYGVDEIEPSVRAWERLVHPDEAEFVMARLSDHLEGRAPFYECEHRLRHKDGSWRWILDRGQVVERDAAGRPLRAVGTHSDVTARHEAEAALKEADRRKDEFLAMLAHELRNPLAAIRMSLQALNRTTDESHAAGRMLGMMDRQSAHLVRLVDDLLEVSRITRGKIELRRERIDLASIVEQAIDTSRPLVESRRHALDVLLPSQPLWLEADPVRITQSVANLLNNAAKYMEPGGRIRLTAEQREGEAVITVRDWGDGIAAEMLPKVFELFTQLGGGIDRAQGGLGLGLALVRRLVELHGGRVEVHSGGLGQGCEFVIRLPLLATSRVEAETAA